MWLLRRRPLMARMSWSRSRGHEGLAHLALLDRGEGCRRRPPAASSVPAGAFAGIVTGIVSRTHLAAVGAQHAACSGTVAARPHAARCARSRPAAAVAVWIVSMDVTSTSSFSTRHPLEVVRHQVGERRGHQRRRPACAGCSCGEQVLDADLAPAGQGEPRVHADGRGAEGALVGLQHRGQRHEGQHRAEQLVLHHAERERPLLAAAGARAAPRPGSCAASCPAGRRWRWCGPARWCPPARPRALIFQDWYRLGKTE